MSTSSGKADGFGSILGDYGLSASSEEARERLTFNLDVDVCVIGAGMAGLAVAREVALRGATVAVLEGRQIAWNASGRTLGVVLPGYDAPIADVVARVGFSGARELWTLAGEGAEDVRRNATELGVSRLGVVDGVLEVSNVDNGDDLLPRLQTLGADFGIDVEGWQTERVRETLKTDRYFHAIQYRKAFRLDGPAYVSGLAKLAEQAGARIYENTPVVAVDPAGVRKRVVTPSARLRTSHIVVAGNVHLGAPLPRLAATLLPVWQYAGMTEPLGARLHEVIDYLGAVMDFGGLDQFRTFGDRLMWSSLVTTWPVNPKLVGGLLRRRIRKVFPMLGDVAMANVWSGVNGHTVHGMPQIGQLRRGLWVASGFGQHGFATSAMAGRLIAEGIVNGDDRWKLFSPFELIWSGGIAGRMVGQAIYSSARQFNSATGALARWRERTRLRERKHAARHEAAVRAERRTDGPRPVRRPPPGRMPPRRDVPTRPGPGSG
jgi:glycine/D-amino acid oxidase-like deaminating enzyme